MLLLPGVGNQGWVVLSNLLKLQTTLWFPHKNLQYKNYLLWLWWPISDMEECAKFNFVLYIRSQLALWQLMFKARTFCFSSKRFFLTRSLILAVTYTWNHFLKITKFCSWKRPAATVSIMSLNLILKTQMHRELPSSWDKDAQHPFWLHVKLCTTQADYVLSFYTHCFIVILIKIQTIPVLSSQSACFGFH